MLIVNNYSCLPILTRTRRNVPGSNDAGITRPVLLPPGAVRSVPAIPLNKESQLKRQAYRGYFIQYLVRFSMSGASFLVSLAAAVLSGGAGIPLVAVTGTAMIIAAGDACCALYNLIQVNNDREPLNTGNDSIVLVTKKLMTSCGMSDLHAETAGDITSFVIRIGTGVSSVFLPFAHLQLSTAHTLACISSAISAAHIIAGGGINIYTARIERMQGYFTASVDPTPAGGAADDSGKLSQEEIRKMIDSIVAAYEHDRAQKYSPGGSPVWAG